jgi:signal transduction histidine kinase
MRGPGLRTRIVALLLFLSIASPAVTVWLVRDRVRRLARATEAQRIGETLAEFEAAIAREAGDVREALDRAAAQAGRDARVQALRGARRDTALLRSRAAPLMQSAGLDCLTWVDGRGVVLSSGHAPGEAGASQPARLQVPEDGVAFIRETIEPGVGPTLTVQSRRVVPEGDGIGGGATHLVGGRLLDSAFLRRLSPGGTVRAVLLDQRGAVLAASDPEDPLPPPPDPAAEGGFVADGVPHTYRARSIAGPGGGPIGTLVAAVSQERLARTSAALGRIALAVGAAGCLASLLIGLVLARGVTRPLRLLEEMTRRVGREEFDAEAPADAPGEVGDLTRAFNRMAAGLRDSRARLVQAERAAAAEEVARRVTHEIKNPLSPIALTLEGLLRIRRERPLEFDAAFEEGVRVLREEVRRMRGILDDFGRFGRLPLPRPRPTDLNALVRDLLPLWSATGSGSRVTADLDPSLPALPLDPDRMSEVIGNLVGNALQALDGGGGTVTVATRREPGSALLAVRDTGPGLADATRVFEPYYSTRPGGTGLGLAIARRIVADHGGSIEAANRAEGGAEFRVRLPLAGGEPDGHGGPGEPDGAGGPAPARNPG